MAEEKQEDSFSLSEDAPRPVPLVATAASTVANAATAFNDATDRLSQLEKDTLISILVVNMDYILTKNSIDASFQVLKGNPLQPVIRIFGSTSNGQRACLHLHGVLPYIYFRPENIFHVAFESEAKVQLLLPILQKSLEDILFLKRESIAKENQYKNKRRKHIHHLEVVRKKTIYGMCVDPIVFVKVYLNDPGDIKRIASILDDGALAGISMQTYESHIPYLLKFTTDFNISPMGWLHLSDMKFRPPLPSLSQHSQQSELLVANTPVQSSSHPFTSPLTTQFPFLSAMSPIRGKLQALSGSELQQPQVASNDVLSFFTQETVPKQFLWNEEETVNPEDEEDQEVIINGMKVRGKINPEILELLDGLNAEDIFTQRPALETVSDKVESKVAPTPWIREKDSTCEIELDGHCDAIVNAKIPRGEFGKELWEEEKLRCGRKNMQFDPLPVAPFTQSFHRDLYLVENDFAVRLKRLQRKGIALRKASQKIVHHTNQRFGDVLSQFLTAEEQTSKSNSHPLASASRSLRNPLIHTPESDRSTPEAMQIVKTVLQEDISDPDVNQWVEHNMQQALLQNQIDDTGLSEIYSAPDNIVEEYIKSQITQNPANQQVISPVNKDMKDTSSQLDDFEQEEAETTSESYMRQEMEAILSCTQGDNFYEVLQPSNRMKSGSTEKSDDYSFLLPSKKTESDVIELLEDEEDVRESEPLSTTQLVVEKDVLAKQADNNINLANVRTTSMKEESTQYEKLLPAVRRRSDPTHDRNSNRLTSVFKRMKRDHGRGGDDSHLEHSTALPSVIPTLVSTKSTSTVSISSIPISILSKAKSKTKKAVSFAQENIYIEDAPPVNFTPPSDNFNGDESDASSVKLTLQQSTLPEENSTTTMECIDLTEDASPEPKSKASSELTKSNNPYQSALMESECIVLVSPSTPSPQRQQSSSSPAHPSGSINDKYLEKEPYFGMGEDPSLFYCEYCGAKTLMPSFQAPKVSELSDLSNFGLLPAINPPASYSKLEDLPKIDINATNAYNQYMLSRHPIYYKNQVEVFDGGFPGTLNSITKLLFPRASTRFAMYSVTKSRKRCLIPNFRPPKPSFFKAIPTSAAEDDATSMQFLTPEHAQENKWAKSQIATPTQTQHTMHTSSTATTPSSHASETDANHDHMKSLKFGQGNQSFMNKMTRLLVLSMELFCITRKDLLPNPKYDSIQMICWIAKDTISNAEHEFANRLHGLICILPQAFLLKSKQQVMQKQAKDYSTSSTINSPSIDEETIIKLAKEKFSKLMRSSIMHRMDCFATPKDIHIDVVLSEKDLFQAFIDVVQGVDPDFLMGYESQSLSFGYFIKRGHHLGFPCLQLLSRLPKERPSFRNSIINPTFNPDGQPNEDMKSSKHIDGDLDGAEENIPVDRNETDDNHAIDNVSDVGIYIKGRTYLNIWQIMRSEVRLFNSSLQHVVEEVLKERIPSFSWSQLSRWYVQTNSRYKVVDVLFTSTVANILLLDKLDLIRKISESSRLYGIDFYSVLNRGSQYRVEAALLIRSNALEYLLISPSRTKVAQQSAMEAIPLVMEPQSGLYTDPVLVLDFQSLYPSMMIAYNLCFSTCLGKLKPNTQSSEDTTSKLGVVNYPETMTAINSTLHMSKKMSGTKDNKPFIAPNGSVFCSKEVRHGILPRMVKEMLQTRLMVKRSMKQHCAGKQSNSSKVLEKVSDARQLAIKLLCNVTYGYTAAGFSGRMPMAELADAIVQCGRSTLEWTMRTIQNHPTWKAEVVYGDTDSVFVHLPGRSLQQAFAIGEEIAREITAMQPEDVVLKFEKVYSSCILLTKKRYVGNSYESLSQKHSHLDAKGIEMIRRDQCAAAMKIQEKTLRLLFAHRDISLVKSYLTKQWTKILQGMDAILLQDFIFFKEVKFGHYASVSSQPPGAIVTTKALLQDEMAVPPYNWRVPYIVVQGLPNAALKNLVHDPKELLRRGGNLRLNVMYYIMKCINPALDRVLSLCGVDVQAWFRELSKPKVRVRHINYDVTNPYQEQNKDGNHKSNEAIELDFFGRRKTASKLPSKQQTLMDRFTTQATCELCPNDSQPQKNLCSSCLENSMESMTALMQRLNLSLARQKELELQCRACTHSFQPTSLFSKQEMIGIDACQSIECPVFHERNRLITRIEDYQLATRDISSAPT